MIQVRNPRTGQPDYSFEPPTDAALAARCTELRQAQPAWWQAGMEHRIAVLLRWAEAIEAHHEAITAALAIDTGRTAIAAGEVKSASRNIRRWCGYGPTLIAAPVHESGIMPSLRYSHQLVPYQLVGAISPWNFPVALSLIDSVPALLAGCAVFVKPSEVTPRFVEPLKRAIADVPELARVLAIEAATAGRVLP